MKKTILWLSLLLTAGVTQAQTLFRIYDTSASAKRTPIDTLVFSVQYDLQMVTDPEKPDNTTDETVMLRLGKRASQYYSYTSFVVDSVLSADIASGASQQTINEHLSQYSSGNISHTILNNYPEGMQTTLDQVADGSYKVEEPLPLIQWTMTSDTLTVCGYLCQKATTELYGRSYEVWFAPEIPRNEGPWKLRGLPGLILKAQDTQGYFRFTAVGIEQAKEGQCLEIPDKSFRPVSRKELNTLQKRYNEDPVGFIQSTSNIKVTVRDEMGNEKRKISSPYNPFELK